MICIKCGRCNSSLYTVYNKTNIKLNECNRCNEICDEYMEKNTFLIFMNILFLKPEIYRHIVFNRLKYHDRFIHVFFLKMIFLFIIINVYLHPNFESDHVEKNVLSDIFFMNNNFEYTRENDSPSYNCSSYTLFMYKYDEKYKLYGLYNISNNSNISNLVNIHKDKFLTCIFNNKLSHRNVCIVNRNYKHSYDYDKHLIDIFLHNNSQNINKYKDTKKLSLNIDQEGKRKKKKKKKKKESDNDKNENSPNSETYHNRDKNENVPNSNNCKNYENEEDKNSRGIRSNIAKYTRKAISYLTSKLKYESIFKLRRNNLLLKNDLITLKNSDEYNSLYQIINVLIYYNIHEYKIVLETKEKETFNVNYVMKIISNIFFYDKSLKKKNYIKSDSNIHLINKNSNDFCYDKSKESTFDNVCHDYDYIGNNSHGLKGLCKNLIRKINSIFNKNAEEITKKQNKSTKNIKIKQISMYSKLLFSDLDNEKFILKIFIPAKKVQC
ncbi:protein ARV1 [Plasmodium brasilianum]|uniref:Protein ARV n=2 Tax=Plasmodium (Plasmodium) TaxID=418103 RepID=A0A1A8VV83_PLAMA|nr:protein ARV1 [Plasmodium brasilianum]SBS84399.1 conserved Plasmodium protein, unknown function [Plasmodium malariae]